MFIDHFPESADVRVGGDAFKHDGDGTVGQRAVDDVGMPCDPAHIGGTPVNIALVIVEDVLVGDGRVQQIAAGGVQHALGLAG